MDLKVLGQSLLGHVIPDRAIMAAAPAGRIGAGGLAALPEDVLLDVFCHLQIKDLFRLAVTSRLWLRLFTDDPTFLRGPSPAQGHGARLLGFFFQQTRFVSCERMVKDHRLLTASAFAPTFFPTPWSALAAGPTDRALTSFVADDDGAFNYAEPLASRNGIVLMRLVPRASSVYALSHTGVRFGLCNPVTGERHVTAPMDCPFVFGLTVSQCYAIVTDSDVNGDEQRSSRRHVFSQLLVVTNTSCNGRGGHVHVHSYSAATRSWSVPARCAHMEEGLTVACARTAVVHRGAAHWLYEDNNHSPPTKLCILSAELGAASGSSARASWTKLPAAVDVGQTPVLCAGRDGMLSVAGVHGMHVALWTQQEAGDLASWTRARLIRIPIAVPSPNRYAMVMRREWFQFSGGAMLVLFDGGAVFVLDLDKKVVEKLMIALPPRMLGIRCEMIVPYEMNLSEFFAFQGLIAQQKTSHTFDLTQ